MLGKTLGPDYEIVLHDIRDGNPQIAALANERLSGRDKNAPMTDFGKFLMSSPEAKDIDYLANYPSEAANGRPMRSSVSLIRDEERRLVGFLCINYDMSKAAVLKDMGAFLTATHPLSFTEVKMEKFAPSADDAAMIDEARQALGRPLDSLDREERLACLRMLDEKSFFRIKGALETLAKAMNKSRYTLYADLREVRGK